MTPYFTQHRPPAFVATLPPIVENSQLAGSGGYQSPSSRAAAASAALRTPASTVAVSASGSTSTTVVIRSRLSTRQPSTAFAPPLRPEPAPRGTTGTPWRAAARTAACTSGVVARPHEHGGHAGRQQPRRRLVAAVGLQDVRVRVDRAGAREVVQEPCGDGLRAQRSASW